MKSNLNIIQTKHIYNLENVIGEATKNHRKLRKKMEELELDTHLFKE